MEKVFEASLDQSFIISLSKRSFERKIPNLFDNKREKNVPKNF